uniref:Sel-1 suppressor of lin-12-like 2 (C. elegans) n=2 Tax=Peromyscus maniculatus bairdii TaxID=230844 RepID=A0A8C8UKT5_PERMB
MKPMALLVEILIIIEVTTKNTEAERHNKKQKEMNVTTQVSVSKVKQFLSNLLEQGKSSKITNKRENPLEKKKNQHKLKIKGIQNKDLLKRNQNY